MPLLKMDVEENPRQVQEDALRLAKGKGFSKKGKVKGKDKMVRSALGPNQRFRSAKLVDLKARSTGDPQCKFAGGKTRKLITLGCQGHLPIEGASQGHASPHYSKDAQ